MPKLFCIAMLAAALFLTGCGSAADNANTAKLANAANAGTANANSAPSAATPAAAARGAAHRQPCRRDRDRGKASGRRCQAK